MQKSCGSYEKMVQEKENHLVFCEATDHKASLYGKMSKWILNVFYAKLWMF